MTPTNGTNVNFTVTTASNPMSVNNTGDLYYLTREPIENLKPSSQTAADTSYYSRYTPKNDSTSALYPINALPADLT